MESEISWRFRTIYYFVFDGVKLGFFVVLCCKIDGDKSQYRN